MNFKKTVKSKQTLNVYENLHILIPDYTFFLLKLFFVYFLMVYKVFHLSI